MAETSKLSRLLASAMNCRLKLNDIHLELSAIIAGLDSLETTDAAPFQVGEEVRVRDGEATLTVVRLYRTVEGAWWVKAHATGRPGITHDGTWPADALVSCVAPFQVGARVVIKGDRGPVMTVDSVGRYDSGDFKGQQWVQAKGETWWANLLAHDPGVAASNPPVVLGNPFKGKAHRGPAVDD